MCNGLPCCPAEVAEHLCRHRACALRATAPETVLNRAVHVRESERELRSIDRRAARLRSWSREVEELLAEFVVGLGGEVAGGVAWLRVGMGPNIIFAVLFCLLGEGVPECGTGSMVGAEVCAMGGQGQKRVPAMCFPQLHPGVLGSTAVYVEPWLP